MASIVSICNMALDHIGRAQISSDTEASAEAQACARHYQAAVDSVLSAYTYRFQRGLVSLAQLEDNDRASAWAYAYALPDNLLMVRRIVPEAEISGYEYDAEAIRVDYELEGGNIYCDVTPAMLEYSKTTAVDRYPPLVAEAISCALAARLAFPLTRDRSVRGDMLQIAQRARLDAEVWDARQSRHSSDITSDYVTARD